MKAGDEEQAAHHPTQPHEVQGKLTQLHSLVTSIQQRQSLTGLGAPVCRVCGRLHPRLGGGNREAGAPAPMTWQPGGVQCPGTSTGRGVLCALSRRRPPSIVTDLEAGRAVPFEPSQALT